MVKDIKAKQAPRATRQRGAASRERILDAAERLFAETSFAATSTRAIAATAELNIAMLHYHFKGKTDLFEEVFKRGSVRLATRRIELLDIAEKEAAGKPVPLHRIIHAFVAPALEMMASPSNGRHFMLMHSRFNDEPREVIAKIRPQAFNTSTMRFANAFRRTLPGLEVDGIYWRMHFMMGIYIYNTADSGRLEEISAGKCTTKDREKSLNEMIDFIVGGFQAARHQSDYRLSKDSRARRVAKPAEKKSEKPKAAKPRTRSGRA